ncbi:peptidoglycan DD-metalloendopeptidase family protein [Ancylothrix sp. C2]|uniref:peptidoglycan DD-metalloendopeptidase family protein n=1 Tax=Ancylothrix sp. D3o TaxID=2953691 RepID=UPI0021BBB411|nr:peptidoglycan DD-metalloendopeptidase family protein [Ancylothrix sp. D3o]MCT7952852.1 peptidoglycan DD-metalloendopeptidase family protein [Ancylothrix sp. D3o]
MKRAFPKEVKPVSPKDAEIAAFVSLNASNPGLPKQVDPEGKRVASSKAAMIGLAISMGASSLFLPRQGDRAWAAEPIKASPTATAAVSGGIEAAKAASFGESKISLSQDAAIRLSLPGAENPAHKEQTLLPAATAQGSSQNVAPSFNISASFVPQEADGLAIAPQISLFEPVAGSEAARAKNEGTLSVDLQPKSVSETLNQVETKLTGEVNELFNAKQEVLKATQNVALQELQHKRNRLNNAAAEWGSEEFSSTLKAEQPAPLLNGANELPNLTLPVSDQEQRSAVGQSNFTPTGPALSSRPDAPTFTPARQQVPQRPTQAPTPMAGFGQRPLNEPAATTGTGNVLSEKVVGEVSTESTAAVPDLNQRPEAKKVTLPDLSQTVTIIPQGREAVVIDPVQAAQSAPTYRVSPGDTIDGISKNYGIPQTELVKINQLSDPNTIKVDQKLKLPGADQNGYWQPAVTVRPKAKLTDARAKEETASLGVPMANATLPLSAEPTLPVVSLPSEISNTSDLIADQTATTEQALPLVSETEQLSADSETVVNPYVERLRAEINNIRSKTRSSKGVTSQSQQSNLPGNAASIGPVYPSVLNNPASNETVAPGAINQYLPNRHVNPEFDPNRSTRALQVNLDQPTAGTANQNYQTRQTATAANLEVEPVNASLPTGNRNAEPPLVATAPIGAGSYDQIQPRMVSPELPPLSAPDTYLPKGGAIFTGYIWPAQGALTSGYGWRWGRMHAGIDIAAPVGTPIVASAPGVITYAQWNDGGYGNLVEVTHPDGSITLYAHNDRILVREGQQVEQGQQIAEMGSTGFSTGPHLHFELHPRGRGAIDPIALLPR